MRKKRQNILCFKINFLFLRWQRIFNRFTINILTIFNIFNQHHHPYMYRKEYSVLSARIFTFLASLVVFVTAEYSRIEQVNIQDTIISIQNCKSSTSIVFLGLSNRIYQWHPFTQEIPFTLPFISRPRYLTCCKYGSKLSSSYIGIIDEEGQIFITEEADNGFNYLYWSTRDSAAQQISVGNQLMSIYYKNLSLIDIYDIKGQTVIGTIDIDQNISNIQMDIFRNLAVIQVRQFGRLNLKYYRIRDNSIEIIAEYLLPVQFSLPVTLDYSKVDEKTISLLIASNNIYCQAKFDIKFEKFIGQFIINKKSLSKPKICDGDITFLEDTDHISKQNQAQIITQNQILMFACTTDTGIYIYSQFYIFFSFDGLNTRLTSYNQVNEFLIYLTIIGFGCCCFCCRLGARIAGGRNGARDLAKCFSALNFLFCWCPTSNNIIKIEQAIED